MSVQDMKRRFVALLLAAWCCYVVRGWASNFKLWTIAHYGQGGYNG